MPDSSPDAEADVVHALDPQPLPTASGDSSEEVTPVDRPRAIPVACRVCGTAVPVNRCPVCGTQLHDDP